MERVMELKREFERTGGDDATSQVTNRGPFVKQRGVSTAVAIEVATLSAWPGLQASQA